MAIDRRDAIQPGVVDDVLPVDANAAARAKDIVLARRALSARNTSHAAVMTKHGIRQILSFGSGFDRNVN